mgnify:CR=1 FL=1
MNSSAFFLSHIIIIYVLHPYSMSIFYQSISCYASPDLERKRLLQLAISLGIIELIMLSCWDVSTAYNNALFPTDNIISNAFAHRLDEPHNKKYSWTHLTKVHSFTIGRNIRSISNMISIIWQPFLLADRTRKAWRRS